MPTIEKQLLSILKTIEGKGSYVTSGIGKFVLPGLQLEGVGEIGFPLNPIHIKAIIKKARQAPFGKGSRTITDTKVRKTWEIDADQLSFRNPEWQDFLDKLLKSVKKGLGIGKQTVKASLYKLLIYEEGGFFLPHKDSEKEPGMFGTLIVGLPAAHSGGELFVRFDGREEMIDFASAAGNFAIAHAAFFADCEHEVKPVTSGYRVCLVYNLLQSSGGRKIESVQFSTQVEQLGDTLRKMASTFEHLPKAVILGHQYTSANFSLETLKQHDRPRAEALLKAADEAGYFARLALLTYYQMGELEGADHYFDNRYSYRNRYSEPKPGTMGEIHEQYTHIEYWEEDRGFPGLGDIYLEEDRIISDIELADGDPVEQEEEGYTGNAGMTIEYWYHYGAVVIWPKSRHADLLQAADIGVKLQWIDFYLRHWEDEALGLQLFVRQLLKTMVINKEEKNYRYNRLDYTPVAAALSQLNDKKFLKDHGRPLLKDLFRLIKVKAWTELLHIYSPSLFVDLFAEAAGTKDQEVTLHLLKIFKKLRASDKKKIQSFLQQQIETFPDYLKKLKLYQLDDLPIYRKDEAEKRKKTVASIVSSVLALSPYMEKDKEWRNAVMKHLTQPHTRTYVNEILVPILLSQKYKKRALTKKLHAFCEADLQSRIAAKPEPPADWKRPVPESKYYKEVWEILKPFLDSPVLKVFEYRKNESYRSTMESAIRDASVDLKMETIRKGSPHTLRLTKTQAAYEKALKEWEEDVDLLAVLLRSDGSSQ